MKLVSKPIEETYPIKADADGKLKATFRQVSFAESRELNSLRAGMRIVEVGNEDDKSLAMEQDINQSDLVAKAIYLSMSGLSGVEDEEGNEIDPVEFKVLKGVRRISMTSKEFDEVIGTFPDEVVAEMYEKVLLMNPQWGNKKKSKN